MKTFEHYQYLSIRTDPVFTDLGHVGAAEDWALTSWPSIILAVQEDSQIKINKGSIIWSSFRKCSDVFCLMVWLPSKTDGKDRFEEHLKHVHIM